MSRQLKRCLALDGTLGGLHERLTHVPVSRKGPAEGPTGTSVGVGWPVETSVDALSSARVDQDGL